ncbi:dihydropteroate synthase [Paenibacillus sp. CMAA1364]
MRTTIYDRTYSCGPTQLRLGQSTLIMGILNVTPDSFSDGGQYMNTELAVQHALQMIADGADLIDIGGESTRPGSTQVGMKEELARVIPVIKAIHQAAPHIPISVDTYKACVARQAIQAGAHIINDIWRGVGDPEMLSTVAELAVPIILMHNRHDQKYTNLIENVIQDLQDSIDLALQAGVHKDNIMVDPGIGFAKDYDDNIQVMMGLDTLSNLGYPVLLATSRKKFIRTALDLPVDDIVEGTAATVAFGIAQGCQIVRVHDVAAIKRTVQMCDAMLYGSAGSNIVHKL